VWHEGVTTFIATLDGFDESDWSGRSHLFEGFTARVSADGTHLVFDSVRSLTGYDNTIAGGAPCGHTQVGVPLPRCSEVYLYDATAKTLVCASCDPSGARPTGGAGILGSEAVEGGTEGWEGLQHLPRNLSADGGRLFFETPDALVPGDSNGQQDVYEYENGRPRLVSGGTSAAPSSFLDASASGNDVFFQTQASLVAQDIDQSLDVYDARVGGGFPVAAGATECKGAGCQGALPASVVFGTPASSTFAGAGNLAAPAAPAVAPRVKARAKRCGKGYVKRRGRCVRKPGRAKRANVTAKRGK
jgi:hypothetical protein